jgi:hypothetical protein
MAKKRTDRELELRYRFRFRVLDVIGAGLTLAVPWGSLILIAWMVTDSVNGLAGKYTFADIGVRFLADVKVSEAIAYAVGAGGMLYGYRERRLRQKNIARLSGRNQDHERRIDPKRSSSGLTPEGKTRPEDRG